MWKRAVWAEGKREEDGVIPGIWVKGEYAYWPPGVTAEKAMKERREPTEKWRKFKLVKIKCTSGKIFPLSKICNYTLEVPVIAGQ